MAKHKLERFAEMETFKNVFQPKLSDLIAKNFPLKGKWKTDYFKNDEDLIIELGCGKGEYTVGLARLFRHKNFIGMDIKGARIWRGAKTALTENMPNVAFLRTKIDMVNSVYEAGEVDEIWVTFPDPQPKKPLKRLTSSKFLSYYRGILKSDGLVHLKTDSFELYEYTMELLKLNNLTVHYHSNNLYDDLHDDPILGIKTFYETRFLGEGKKINYIKFSINNPNELIEPEKKDE
jgi:tRNA (guanine-N7-)-methyltransferase